MNMMHDYKQNKLAVSVLLIGCLATVLGATGCQQQDEGTAEKAGKKSIVRLRRLVKKLSRLRSH
nr:hypothetical protein [Methylomarinum sp. Ch1-1]MDP4519702.1 hypothetical protein [Methylomarinum sp. Ch1-1]